MHVVYLQFHTFSFYVSLSRNDSIVVITTTNILLPLGIKSIVAITTNNILIPPCRYKGPVDVFRVIMKEEGFFGFWRGWVPNCQRAAIVCLGG